MQKSFEKALGAKKYGDNSAKQGEENEETKEEKKIVENSSSSSSVRDEAASVGNESAISQV